MRMVSLWTVGLLGAAFLLVGASSTLAQTTAVPGDVLVAGPPQYLTIGFGTTPLPVRVFSATGVLKTQFGHAVIVSTRQSRILLSDGYQLRANDLSLTELWNVMVPDGIAVIALDDAGRSFVTQSNGTRHASVYEYDSSGNLRTSFPLTDGWAFHCFGCPESGDVAPDNCVLWFVDGFFRARRYDTCRGTLLGDPAPGQTFNDVRALSGGGFIGTQGRFLRVYDASGILVRSIVSATEGNISSFAFSEDARSVWVIGFGQNEIRKLNLVDGSTLASIPLAGC